MRGVAGAPATSVWHFPLFFFFFRLPQRPVRPCLVLNSTCGRDTCYHQPNHSTPHHTTPGEKIDADAQVATLDKVWDCVNLTSQSSSKDMSVRDAMTACGWSEPQADGPERVRHRGPDQAGPDRTRPDHTIPDHTIPDQTKLAALRILGAH